MYLFQSPNVLDTLLAVLSFILRFEFFLQIAAYIKNRTDFLPRFMSHLGTSAIMDLLLQLVAVPEGEQTRLGLAVVRWRGGVWHGV